VFTTLQQGLNQAVASRTGLANGYYVSLYPLGAMIGAPLLGWAIAAQGLRVTLAALAVTILLSTAVAAWLYRAAACRCAIRAHRAWTRTSVAGTCSCGCSDVFLAAPRG